MSPYAISATAAIYLATLFAVAWWSGRRADNATFFTGNRRSPWWAVALGMIAAPMSGVTFVSVPGMVGVGGWAYLQMAMGFVCGYLVIAYVLVPLLYRRRVVSVYEYLGGRFGVSSHRTGAWFFFVGKLLGAGLKIYLVCLVLQLLVFGPLGVPFWVNALILPALVWLYTFRGGVRAIVWTDGLKTLCLVASVGLSIWFIARELGLDFRGIVTAVGDSDMSRVWFFDDVNDRRYFFKQFISGLFIVVAMTGLDQDMMQLPLSCRTPRDSQKNFVASGLAQFAVIALFLSLGVLLNLYATARGLATPATGDELYPLVATHGGLPQIVGIVFALGLIASTYSAAGSALTALTTSFTVDILGRGSDGGSGYAGQSAEQSDMDARLARTRRMVHTLMALALAAVIMAFRALAHTSVIDAVYVLASYTYGPILGLFAIASPALCLVLDLGSEAWLSGYRFGYELLILNALFTIIGLTIISKRK